MIVSPLARLAHECVVVVVVMSVCDHNKVHSVHTQIDVGMFRGRNDLSELRVFDDLMLCLFSWYSPSMDLPTSPCNQLDQVLVQTLWYLRLQLSVFEGGPTNPRRRLTGSDVIMPTIDNQKAFTAERAVRQSQNTLLRKTEPERSRHDNLA